MGMPVRMSATATVAVAVAVANVCGLFLVVCHICISMGTHIMNMDGFLLYSGTCSYLSTAWAQR